VAYPAISYVEEDMAVG